MGFYSPLTIILTLTLALALSQSIILTLTLSLPLSPTLSLTLTQTLTLGFCDTVSDEKDGFLFTPGSSDSAQGEG
jgi:hypothetical protein